MNDSILIVDDCPENLRSVSMLLTHMGFKIETAEGGREGITMLKRGNYFAVLLDYGMPEVNGIDFLCEVGDLLTCRGITTIATTASMVHGEECLDNGADYFLPKPLDFDRVASLLNSIRPSSKSAVADAKLFVT